MSDLSKGLGDATTLRLDEVVRRQLKFAYERSGALACVLYGSIARGDSDEVSLDHNRSKQSGITGELLTDTQLLNQNGALPEIAFLS